MRGVGGNFGQEGEGVNAVNSWQPTQLKKSEPSVVGHGGTSGEGDQGESYLNKKMRGGGKGL